MQLRKRTVGVEHSLRRSPWRKDAVIELKFGVCFVIRRRRYSGDENWMIWILEISERFYLPCDKFLAL